MNKLLLAAVSLFVAVSTLSLSKASAAGVNDFVINRFNADYVLSADEPGGKLMTTEDIDLTYSAYNHGILRAIPADYKGWNTKLKIDQVLRDGVSEPYTTYSENGNLVVKIGRSDATITGHHDYELVYEQRHVVNFGESTPEFFWDVNGTQWMQPFSKVTATVHLPQGALAKGQPACFSGGFRSTTQNCQFAESVNQIDFTTTRSLNPGENLTIAVPLKPGVFSRPTAKDFIKDNLSNIFFVVAGVLVALVVAGVWFAKGRDYGGKGVIIPEYGPPPGVGPAEAGLLYDYEVDSSDMTAILIDLAIRRYIKIHDASRKILFFRTKNYKLELLNNDYSALKDYEKRLMNAIFDAKATASVGKIVDMKKIDKLTMGVAVDKIRKDMQKNLTDQYGYFEKNAKKLSNIMRVSGFILFIGSIALRQFWISAGGIIAALSLIFFGRIMPRRSHAGTEIYEKIQGLKLYMDTAEKDRLKMMQSADRPYAEPSKTVELYEKLLPYAVALGVEKSWTKQFEGVLNETPGWYSGYNTGTFNAAVFASSLNSVSSSFGSSFASSGSGDGGGFSGGGGGGGGGGGW